MGLFIIKEAGEKLFSPLQRKVEQVAAASANPQAPAHAGGTQHPRRARHPRLSIEAQKLGVARFRCVSYDEPVRSRQGEGAHPGGAGEGRQLWQRQRRDR